MSAASNNLSFCGIDLLVLGRSQLIGQSYKGFAAGTYVISIVDTDALPVRLRNRPSGILRLSFDDVENVSKETVCGNLHLEDEDESDEACLDSIFTPISADQAYQIAGFIQRNIGKMKTLICSCEAGQSRSAAVAAAVMEHYAEGPSSIFEDIRFHPNRLVFDKVKEALRRKGRI